ncbi:uncharacterized protein [Canis lupus baileyi]|uniref:uncharacterized protein isoform X1 n=1 Tax=Canis lupus baileyi TaxID=143281 RepID=UPI003B972D8C
MRLLTAAPRRPAKSQDGYLSINLTLHPLHLICLNKFGGWSVRLAEKPARPISDAPTRAPEPRQLALPSWGSAGPRPHPTRTPTRTRPGPGPGPRPGPRPAEPRPGPRPRTGPRPGPLGGTPTRTPTRTRPDPLGGTDPDPDPDPDPARPTRRDPTRTRPDPLDGTDPDPDPHPAWPARLCFTEEQTESQRGEGTRPAFSKFTAELEGESRASIPQHLLGPEIAGISYVSSLDLVCPLAPCTFIPRAESVPCPTGWNPALGDTWGLLRPPSHHVHQSLGCGTGPHAPSLSSPHPSGALPSQAQPQTPPRGPGVPPGEGRFHSLLARERQPEAPRRLLRRVESEALPEENGCLRTSRKPSDRCHLLLRPAETRTSPALSFLANSENIKVLEARRKSPGHPLGAEWGRLGPLSSPSRLVLLTPLP